MGDLYTRTWDEILEDCEDIEEIQTKADAKFRAKFDFEFFLSKILGLRTDSKLIQDLIDLVQNPPDQEDNKIIKIARLAPRGHSKTYTSTVGQALWRAFSEQGIKILIVSATREQATGILDEEIKRFINRNEALQHLKPSTEFLNKMQEQGSDGNLDIDKDEAKWAAQSITTTTDVRIKAKPFSSSIRSMHMDYVLCDDLLSDEESGTRDVEAEKNLYYNVITPTAESQGEWIQVVGTPQKHNDLIMELIDKEEYNTGKYQAHWEDEDGENQVLWEHDPETDTGWTYDGLMSKKREIGSARFAKEYMCVEEGTPVQLKNGWKYIEDVEIGDEVLTHKGNYKEVINTFDNGKKDIYNIYTPGYSESVGLTANHPVLTKEGWKYAEDLSKDDFVLSPRMRGEKSLNDSRAKVYGWYAAEGAIGANGRQVVFYVREDESEELHEALEDLGYSPKYYGGNSDKMNPVTINSKTLATELEDRFGRSKEKKVWSEIHEMDLKTQEKFLRSYIEGDGYEKRDGIYSSRSVCLPLSEGMARIATSLGWTVTRDYENPPFEETVNIGSRGGDVSCSEWHRVRYYENESKRAEVTEDYVAYPVDAVVKNGSAQVYNLEVEEDNSYHLPMFAVHNCNPMSVDEQFFDYENCIQPNLYKNLKADHWKPDIQSGAYDDWLFAVGVDIALQDGEGADYTVFQVLGKDPEGQVWQVDMHRERGMTPKSIAEKLKSLDDLYSFETGYVEKNAIGEGVWKTIKEKANDVTYRVDAFDTTRKTRPKILSNLQAALEGRKLIIKETGDMVDEMMAFRLNNKNKLEGKGHDDTVMSLAIAWHAVDDGDTAPASMALIGADGEEESDYEFEDDDDWNTSTAEPSDAFCSCGTMMLELPRYDVARCPSCEHEEDLEEFRAKKEAAERIRENDPDTDIGVGLV